MSNKKDNLGDRMKRYEGVPRIFLTRRVPVIIRLDGKAFHTFTKGMKRPFDDVLRKTMQETMQDLCKNIQGCVLGYTQSDEITLVLTDYKTITTDSWFGYNVQKMVSISASMATLAFNKFFRENVENLFDSEVETFHVSKDHSDYVEKLEQKIDKAMFDSRVFSVPKDEVCNCLIWRQQDASRNSIQLVGQANFSHKELDKKSCNEIQEMLFSLKNINWNDYPTDCKRGACCYKRTLEKEVIIPKTGEKNVVNRSDWFIDKEIPIFSQDRSYVERWL